MSAREHAESDRIEALKAAGLTVEYVDREAVDGIGTGRPCLAPYGHYRHRVPGEGRRAYVDLSSIARGDDGAGQSSTVDRSNFRSLIRDYPDAFTPTAYVNCDALGAFVDDLADQLTEILTGLAADYPVYDESDLSELESEEITESWDQYVQHDMTREMRDAPDEGDAWDALTGDQQRDLFWQVVSDLDIYPEHDGRDIRWEIHYAAIAAEVYKRLNG